MLDAGYGRSNELLDTCKVELLDAGGLDDAVTFEVDSRGLLDDWPADASELLEACTVDALPEESITTLELLSVLLLELLFVYS